MFFQWFSLVSFNSKNFPSFSKANIQAAEANQVKNKIIEKSDVDYMKALKVDPIAENEPGNQGDTLKNVNLVQMKEIRVESLATVRLDIISNNFDKCEFVFKINWLFQKFIFMSSKLIKNLLYLMKNTVIKLTEFL